MTAIAQPRPTSHPAHDLTDALASPVETERLRQHLMAQVHQALDMLAAHLVMTGRSPVQLQALREGLAQAGPAELEPLVAKLAHLLSARRFSGMASSVVPRHT